MSKRIYNHFKIKKHPMMLVLMICLLNFSSIIFAQNTQWIYIAKSTEGRYFVKEKIDRISKNKRGMWMKILAEDGSEQLSYSEWSCRDRRFRLKQTSIFAPDGTTTEQLKSLDWAYAAPETAAETLYERACGNPPEIKSAVIILKEVKLRAEPSLDGQVYRTAKHNERFPLTPFNPVGAWYQIYDPKTLVEYWIHGNGIKIVSLNNPKPQVKKTRIKRNSSAKKNLAKTP